MKHGNNDDSVILNRKIDRVRKSSRQCAPNSRTKILICKWAIENSQVCCAKLIEEFKTQAGFFSLIPFETGLDLKLDDRCSFESILFHFRLSERRSITSNAGRAADRFSR